MPEITLKLIVFLVGVGGFTLLAAISDLRFRRIPNRMTVPMFLLGLVFQAVFNGWAGLAEAGQAFALGFGVLFLLWMIGGGGGGDVKLMGALSVWLGFRLTLSVMVVSTVLVLAGTLGVMLWSMLRRGAKRTARKYVATFQSDKKGKPVRESLENRQDRRIMAYAIPVGIATWAVVLLKLPQL